MLTGFVRVSIAELAINMKARPPKKKGNCVDVCALFFAIGKRLPSLAVELSKIKRVTF